MNERITEELVRKVFREKEFENYFMIEEQKSSNPIIQKHLKNASKSGNGGGKPEFILLQSDNAENLIIFECKPDKKYHKSKNMDNAKDYAVDGALHYAAYLSKAFNVLAVAVSGQEEKNLQISNYLWIKGESSYRELPSTIINSPHEYINFINTNPQIQRTKTAELYKIAGKIHNEMRDKAKLSESEKPLLVSAVLIALSDSIFASTYTQQPKPQDLADDLIRVVEKVLKNASIPQAKIKNMVQPYSFIQVHPELTNEKVKKDGKYQKNTVLVDLIREIDLNIKPFIQTYQEFDVVGKFYGEFLKYTGGDRKGLGIVLTPKHITELMIDLVRVNKDTVLLDTCTGTGQFLISGMTKMIKEANGDEKEIEKIKKERLVGVEQQPHMYAMAASNMILRGDGKANLYQGSCFSFTEQLLIHKPNAGTINPPYSQKGEGLSELDFIEHMLDCLEPNSLGAAIVPMSVAISPNKKKQDLLNKHSLEAVMSMPDELFYPVGTVTCIIIFRAKIPHDVTVESWFGYWKDDGFIKTKNEGRVDLNNSWEEIKKKWLINFYNKNEIVGECIKKSVTADDEWCAEAYLNTDYSQLTKEDFENELKKYSIFKVLSECDLNG
jgi:type I restriction enzyme M protein